MKKISVRMQKISTDLELLDEAVFLHVTPLSTDILHRNIPGKIVRGIPVGSVPTLGVHPLSPASADQAQPARSVWK